MNTNLLLLILAFFTSSCNGSKNSLQGEWTGTGHVTNHKSETTTTYDQVKFSLQNDTFKITGLNQEFYGILILSQNKSTVNLISFDSYEYDIYKKNNEFEERGYISVNIEGDAITDEFVKHEGQRELEMSFHINRVYPNEGSLYILKLHK